MKNDAAVRIAQLVKENRTRLNYTQQELANKSGISLRSLQRIENAAVMPRAYTLNVLSKELSIDLHSASSTASPDEAMRLRAALYNLNRTQKRIATIGLALLLILITAAVVFQSPSFPETAFELVLLIAGVMGVYFLLLMVVWRR